MRDYIFRRLLLMVPTMFLVTLIVFMLIRLVPGDAIDAMVDRLAQQGTEVDVARGDIERLMGLDVPVIQQYARWIGVWPQADGNISGIFQGDFGQSYWRETTVLHDIAGRWPITVQLGLMAIIISQFIALPIGITSALRQDTWGDYAGRSFAIVLIAVPSFWIATMVIVFPAIWWGYFPPIMHVPFIEDPMHNIRRFIVPAAVLGMAMSGGTMRITRTMMLEVLRQDYIRTAWAKGLQEKMVILRHTLKNALIPVVTVIGQQVPLLVGGTTIIETIFVLPGMGLLTVEATRLRDYPVLSGVLLILGSFVMVNNLVVDLTYGFLDPRIRYK
jgi:peptide/nickel transport system permease protein